MMGSALPINVLEFVPIYLTCEIWAANFARRKIEFHCDNLGVVQAWHRHGSSNRAILAIMRRLVAVAARFNFAVNIRHVPGSRNEIADALSRLQIQRFRQLCPDAAANPTPVPQVINEVLKECLSLQND